VPGRLGAVLFASIYDEYDTFDAVEAELVVVVLEPLEVAVGEGVFVLQAFATGVEELDTACEETFEDVDDKSTFLVEDRQDLVT